MIQISPSVLACDFSRLGEETALMAAGGADMIHLDVMDGHFVPNISFGMPVIAALRKKSDAFFDVHLMISRPLTYGADFVKAGADRVTFHLEAEDETAAVLDELDRLGVEAGISLKPGTPAEAVFPYLERLKMVLVMTVEPGFGGQSFMADMLPKIRAIREEANRRGLALDIQVDGGIDEKTAPLVAEAGANVLVAGSALFSKPDYKAAVSALRQKAQEAVQA
ncbi:ribulose-phosphate 3-epimerase [Oscillospiraceae bacterium MB08-C2-2]|nr:ribulose-phosphate 3-epimerase [Oscillospiraceae bacterium MB08-C2-2]